MPTLVRSLNWLDKYLFAFFLFADNGKMSSMIQVFFPRLFFHRFIYLFTPLWRFPVNMLTHVQYICIPLCCYCIDSSNYAVILMFVCLDTWYSVALKLQYRRGWWLECQPWLHVANCRVLSITVCFNVKQVCVAIFFQSKRGLCCNLFVRIRFVLPFVLIKNKFVSLFVLT